MYQRANVVKWLIYGLVFLPVLVVDIAVTSRLPIRGIIPVLMPLCVAAVATLEGGAGGAGFGLFVGVLCDALYGYDGTLTLLLPFCGAFTGIITRYALRQNVLGCLICSFFTLAFLDLFHMLYHFFSGVAFLPLLAVAAAEILYSLPFVFLIYPLNLWVHRRTGGSKYL